MALQGYIYDDTCIADAAISAFRVVVAGESVDENGAKHVKLPAAQDANAIIGITQNSTSASGDIVLVRRAGITKLTVSSANVTYGVPLRPFNILGHADVQAAAWASGDGVIGYAEGASAASGDIIECWLAIQTLLG